MEYVGEETIIEADSGEGGWVETHHFGDAAGGVEEKLSEMTMESTKEEQEKARKAEEEEAVEEMRTPENTHNDPEDDDDDDDEACDMEEFAESGMLEKMDPAAVRAPKPIETVAAAAAATPKEEEGGIVKTRTYDLHITYDKYYQTPRLWVVGYNEVREEDLILVLNIFVNLFVIRRTESH